MMMMMTMFSYENDNNDNYDDQAESKNDRRNSGGTLRQKFNLNDI